MRALAASPDSTVADVSAELGISADDVRSALHASTVVDSLDRTVHFGETAVAFVDTIASDDSDPYDAVTSDVSALRAAMSSLEEAERGIVEHRFGIADGKIHSLAETAAVFGIPDYQVRKVQRRAVAKLRALMNHGADAGIVSREVPGDGEHATSGTARDAALGTTPPPARHGAAPLPDEGASACSS